MKCTNMGLAPPDHPMFKEGPRSYSPHWVRELMQSTNGPKANSAGPDTSQVSGTTKPTKPTS